MAQAYNVTHRSKTSFNVCYNHTTITHGGSAKWNTELPMFIIQILSIMLLSHILAYVLKPLRQPRTVANILAGVLLGPSAFSITSMMGVIITPLDTIMPMETMANLGLVYHVFMIGLDFELRPVVRAGKKAISITLAGIAFAITAGLFLHTHVLFNDFETVKQKTTLRNVEYGPIFWGIILAGTNFADITQILADFKLLHSEVGILALSDAIISDVSSWFLFLMVMAILGDGQLYTVLLTLGFIAVCVFVLMPALTKAMCYTTKDESISDSQMCFILFGIVLSGLITDACGGHSLVGPFILGAIMPRGMHFKQLFKDRVGNLVEKILMPLFYLVIGARFNSFWLFGDFDQQLKPESNVVQLVAVVVLAFTAKSVGTFIAALCNKMTIRDSLVLGIIMNTKGLLALILLSSSVDLKALDNQTYGVMLVSIWVMTASVGPILAFLCNTTQNSALTSQHRSIQNAGADTKLRILACTHSVNDASGILSLVEASNPSKKSPIHVLAVKLVELTDHNTAMLIVQEACKKSESDDKKLHQSDFKFNAFENYAREREDVSVQSLTVVSAYATMHQDICNMADEKDFNFIIIPFHKEITIDGVPDDRYDPLLAETSKKVMENAKCSVGLLVDNGFVTTRITEFRNASSESHNFAMFFIGGPNDREALAYAWRMAGHPRVKLTVVRFTVSKEAWEEYNQNDKEHEAYDKIRQQKQLDDSCIDDFKLKSMNAPSIIMSEKMANNFEGIVNTISTMEGQYQLYILGRSHDSFSPLTLQSFESNGSNKLGTLGETLASSIFLGSTSLLIMQ